MFQSIYHGHLQGAHEQCFMPLSIKHCSWAPWRWSWIRTETCRGKFF